MDHIVFFKWKENASQSAIDAAVAGIYELRNKIPNVVSISCGESFTDARAKGFTHGVVVRLRSKADLPVYAKHEAHLKLIKEHIKPILDGVCALDWAAPRLAPGRDDRDDYSDSDSDGDEAAASKLRRQGSWSVPPDMQKELMEEYHRRGGEIDSVEREKRTATISMGLAGLAAGAVLGFYLARL